MNFTYSTTRYSVVNGNWNATSAWSGAFVPVTQYVVTIEGDYMVTITVNAACASLKIISRSTLIANTLTLIMTGTRVDNGIFTPDGGTVLFSKWNFI